MTSGPKRVCPLMRRPSPDPRRRNRGESLELESPVVPLGSDCLDLTTTEDPTGKSRPNRSEPPRSSGPIATGDKTAGISSSDESPEPEGKERTSSRGDFSKEILDEHEPIGILRVGKETGRSASGSEKPSKLKIESSFPGSLFSELVGESSSLG